MTFSRNLLISLMKGHELTGCIVCWEKNKNDIRLTMKKYRSLMRRSSFKKISFLPLLQDFIRKDSAVCFLEIEKATKLNWSSQDSYLRLLFLSLIACIVANNHLDVPLQMVLCKEDGPPDDQNQRAGGAGLLQMTIWIIRPPPCSSVPLQMVICKEDSPSDDQHYFGRMGRTRPAPSMKDPQYKISAQTDQRFRS